MGITFSNSAARLRMRAVPCGLHTLHGYWWRALNKVKVKCTLVQALRLCTGRTVRMGSRGIAFYLRERPGTHCTGGWVGLRAGLDRCRKSRLHRDSIPGPSST